MKKHGISALLLSLALLAGCGAGQASPGADGPEPCGTSEDIRQAAALEAATPFGDDWQESGTPVTYENGYISMSLPCRKAGTGRPTPARTAPRASSSGTRKSRSSASASPPGPAASACAAPEWTSPT